MKTGTLLATLFLSVVAGGVPLTGPPLMTVPFEGTM